MMIKEIKKWASENPGKFLSMVMPFMFAAVGSISTVGVELTQAYMTGAKFGESAAAYKQKTMWTENLNCLQNIKPTEITNESNIKVNTVVCPSGDVLVTAQKPGEVDKVSRWVDIDGMFEEETGVVRFNFLSEAYADDTVQWTEINQQQVWLRCSYVVGSLIAQVMTNGYACTTYFIDPYSGRTVKTNNSCGCGS